jgi:putative addiction module antidote
VWELKLRKIGNSVGLVLPKEVLARLNVAGDDAICLTECADGSLRISAADPGFAHKIKVAERLSRRYRDATKDLKE